MPKIVIVGAGINGLTLAISLRQLGFEPDDIAIFEKAETARAEGTGIIFWAEAISLLKRIGVDLTQAGVCLPHLTTLFLRQSEEPLAIDIKKEPNQAAYGFLREKIYNQLLIKAKQENLRIQTGYDCESVQEDSNGCTIQFKNGKSVSAEVVIGCDGIYSTIRQTILPTVQPIALNIKAVRGTYTCNDAERERLNLPVDACQIYCGSQYRVLLYPNYRDLQHNLTSYYWFAAHRTEPNAVHANESIDEMITQLPLCPEKLLTIFRDTPESDIIRSSTLRQLPFANCTSGRIALLGDSAHAMAPTAGLGFLLGITNALYLAGHLALNRTDIPQALKQYSASVAEHSKACLEYTSQLTDLFYVEKPLNTAATAKDIYAELYTLIAKSAGNAVEFYNTVMRPRDEAAIVLQNVSREYLARKKLAQPDPQDPASSVLIDNLDEKEKKTEQVFRKLK